MTDPAKKKPRRPAGTAPPPPACGPMASRKKTDGVWTVSLTERGTAFLAAWFAEHPSGVGLLVKVWPGLYRQARACRIGNDELVSYCHEAAVRAATSWSPDGGATFKTYFGHAIRNVVSGAVRSAVRHRRNAGRTIAPGVAWERGGGGGRDVPLDQLLAARAEPDADGGAAVRRMIAAGVPNERDRRLVSLLWGLTDGETRTLQHVADAFGISKEWVRRIGERAKRLCREYLADTGGGE